MSYICHWSEFWKWSFTHILQNNSFTFLAFFVSLNTHFSRFSWTNWRQELSLWILENLQRQTHGWLETFCQCRILCSLVVGWRTSSGGKGPHTHGRRYECKLSQRCEDYWSWQFCEAGRGNGPGFWTCCAVFISYILPHCIAITSFPSFFWRFNFCCNDISAGSWLFISCFFFTSFLQKRDTDQLKQSCLSFQLSPEQRKNLGIQYVESGAKRAVETRLLSFLTYNHYHLPMYAKPGVVWGHFLVCLFLRKLFVSICPVMQFMSFFKTVWCGWMHQHLPPGEKKFVKNLSVQRHTFWAHFVLTMFVRCAICNPSSRTHCDTVLALNICAFTLAALPRKTIKFSFAFSLFILYMWEFTAETICEGILDISNRKKIVKIIWHKENVHACGEK